jgi:predicted metal-dependent hydrolase
LASRFATLAACRFASVRATIRVSNSNRLKDEFATRLENATEHRFSPCAANHVKYAAAESNRPRKSAANHRRRRPRAGRPRPQSLTSGKTSDRVGWRDGFRCHESSSTNCTARNTLASTNMEAGEYPPLYLKGIEYFNQCDFFESHEVWEELWAENYGPSRKFLQGLIQAAVALHHFGNGNIRGAKKLYYGSRGYLAAYRPRHMGLDVERFLTDMDQCFAEVVENTEEFPTLEIKADDIPEIHLEPPPAA